MRESEMKVCSCTRVCLCVCADIQKKTNELMYAAHIYIQSKQTIIPATANCPGRLYTDVCNGKSEDVTISYKELATRIVITYQDTHIDKPGSSATKPSGHLHVKLTKAKTDMRTQQVNSD